MIRWAICCDLNEKVHKKEEQRMLIPTYVFLYFALLAPIFYFITNKICNNNPTDEKIISEVTYAINWSMYNP